eukprot:2720553-Amphidinium_carterae.1
MASVCNGFLTCLGASRTLHCEGAAHHDDGSPGAAHHDDGSPATPWTDLGEPMTLTQTAQLQSP